jgi:aminopeptidase-like protein
MTSMLDLIYELWYLPRDIVSDGYDRALLRLSQEVPMQIHAVASGTTCWTWRVPEKWTCQEAYLESLKGSRIVDWQNHPLHVVSYSLPFEGVVSRDELLKHLHVHPRLVDAIPFVFKYYDRDWGLCMPQTLRDQLVDDYYRVVIRTTFEPGTLKIGEIVVPGESRQTLVLVAHLCHPAMVNDDLTGVVAMIDVARALISWSKPYYTYRFLLVPETIGSVAYLSQNEALIPDMVGGLFLEMLGNDSAHALQGSFQPGSQVDHCFSSTLKNLDPDGYYAPYRSVINNDERQFNASGVRVPMLSLSRVEPVDSMTRPYREYHSSLDTPVIVTQERLEASRDLVLSLIRAWENNQYIINQFKGEIFCSGYGIWIDYRVNPEGHRRLFEIMERCDGTRTVADIAVDLGISFQSVWDVVTLLRSKQLMPGGQSIGGNDESLRLITLSRKPLPTDLHLGNNL